MGAGGGGTHQRRRRLGDSPLGGGGGGTALEQKENGERDDGQRLRESEDSGRGVIVKSTATRRPSLVID